MPWQRHPALYSGVTEPLSKALNAKGISSAIKSRGSLRETFVKPKDKLPKEQSVGVIYHIPCAGAISTACPGTYVGETEKNANARFQEHTSTATNALGKFKSAMLQHARENNHHFRKEDVSILDREENWVKLGIKEAIYIKALSPSINIDPGRHSLSSHFDNTIRGHIRAPPAPLPHNANSEPLINTTRRGQGRPRKQPAAVIPSLSNVPLNVSRTNVIHSNVPSNVIHSNAPSNKNNSNAPINVNNPTNPLNVSHQQLHTQPTRQSRRIQEQTEIKTMS